MQRIILNKITQTKAVATIGNFDGMHLGHQQLFHNMRQLARDYNYRTIVITFEPLPLEYFSDQKANPRLTRISLLRDKFLVLKQLGYIDELVVLHFNAAIANLLPKQFIENILEQKLNVEHVVIGHDFKFGKNGAGGVKDFALHGIKTTVVSPYKYDDQIISSSILRNLALANKLSEIKQYLGRNLHYTSRVIYGNQLGRQYSVPTINLSLGNNKPAMNGIFVARVYIHNNLVIGGNYGDSSNSYSGTYNAVISIGKNPTINKLDKYKLEAHLLDVNLNLYGKIVTIEILEFIREEKKFNDLDSLFKQIHEDITVAKRFFET